MKVEKVKIQTDYEKPEIFSIILHHLRTIMRQEKTLVTLAMKIAKKIRQKFYLLTSTCKTWLASKVVPGLRIIGCVTCPDSTHIIFGYSSLPKSAMSLAFSHGFQTTANKKRKPKKFGSLHKILEKLQLNLHFIDPLNKF